MIIDFYIYSTHEVVVWENIIAKLIDFGVSAKFVLEPPDINVTVGSISNKSTNWFDDKKHNLHKLMTDDVFNKSDSLIKSLNLPLIYESRYDADAVVTTQGAGWFERYGNRIFRTMYGVGATTNSYGHSIVNIGCDAIFVHGQFSKKEISKILNPDKVHITGFPKWVKYFRNELSKLEIKAKFGITNNKPTVVYIPTWAQNSSLDKFANDIINISDEFNLLIKPHHNNINFENERIEVLLNKSNIISAQEINLIYYYAIADLIITDVKSGGFTEAFLVDCPIIGLSANDDIKKNNLIENIDKAAEIICKPNIDFNKIIHNLINLKINNTYKNKFKDYFFENLNGEDDTITANKMIEILDTKKILNIPMNMSKNDMNPVISVIIPTYNRRDILELTLKSLENQTFDKQLYEVIVIDDGSTDDTIKYLENYNSKMNLKFASQKNSGPATARNKGIKLSTGKYLLFLNDDAVCNNDLLDVHIHFHKQFEKLNQKVALLGTFDYQKNDLDKMFMNMLHKSTLIFAYSEMKSNEVFGWNYFWTCNISIYRQAVIDAGMFDEQFSEPMMEDVELGLRLQLQGYSIFFTQEAITTHIHTITLESFIKRQEMLGRNTIKMLNKHSIEEFPELQIFGIDNLEESTINELRTLVDNNVEYAEQLFKKIKLFENIRASEHLFINLNGEKKSYNDVQDIAYKLLNELNHYYYYKGLILAYDAQNQINESETESYIENNIVFSIIIPTHDRAEILWKCINSFYDQSFDFDSFEIIIIDDGSVDDTERIVKQFDAPFNITYQKQANAGPAKARNTGIELAKGEYLLFINDDTIAHQDLLAEHFNTHQNSKNFPPENQKIAVLGSFDYVPEVKIRPFVNFLEKTNWVFAYPMMKTQHFYPYRFFWTCNLSIKKSAVIDAGLFDCDFSEPMGEDTELGFRLEKKGYFVYYNSNAISWHDHTLNIYDFTKRQKMNGKNMVLLFKKQPEILSREQNLFGFNTIDSRLISEFKDFIDKNQKEYERSILLIDDIDKIDIFNPNFIPINENFIVNIDDIVKLIDKHIKIIHEYCFKSGIIEGYETFSIEAKDEKPKAKSHINLINSAINAVNAVSKNRIQQIGDIEEITKEKINPKVIEVAKVNLEFVNKLTELENEISALSELKQNKKAANNKFQIENTEQIDDDFDYLDILIEKASEDFDQIDILENNEILEDLTTAYISNDEPINTMLGKKVLFTMFGWNESGGGTMFPKQVALKYAEMGIQVYVFYAGMNHNTVATPYYFEKTTEGNVTLFGVFNRMSHFLLSDYPEVEICDDKVVKFFVQVLDEVNPDVVHFHNFLGLSFKIAEEVKNRNIKSFFTPHNYHLIDPNLYMIKNNLKSWDNTNFFEHSELPKSNSKKMKHYENRVYSARKTLNEFVDYTLAISHREKEILVDFGANAEKIFVVHQIPVITDVENTISKVKDISKPIKFGYIGSVIPHKGVHIIVQAAQMLNKDAAEFHIFGSGNELYKKEMMKIDSKGFCLWHGEYKNDELNSILNELDCVIVPSIWEEAAGLVVLEALSNSVPVIGARIGGIPDFIIENENGRTYPANSVNNLAAILIELVKNPEKIQFYKQNCKKVFSFSNYVNHIIDLYSRAVSNENINNDIAEFDFKSWYKDI